VFFQNLVPGALSRNKELLRYQSFSGFAVENQRHIIVDFASLQLVLKEAALYEVGNSQLFMRVREGPALNCPELVVVLQEEDSNV
jgi:hypothetical protein